jgi:hypothetical protein
VNLCRRYQPLPPYAYCTRCPWSDPDDPQVAGSLAGLGVSVEQAARAHVDRTGHRVRLVRTQEVILRPRELAEVSHA